NMARTLPRGSHVLILPHDSESLLLMIPASAAPVYELALSPPSAHNPRSSDDDRDIGRVAHRQYPAFLRTDRKSARRWIHLVDLVAGLSAHAGRSSWERWRGR